MGYLPRISLPTRVTDHSATLIDNIFSSVLDDSKSGVIINNISDHQMIYTYSTEKKYSPHQSKFIEVENNSRDAVELFLSKLRDSDQARVQEFAKGGAENLKAFFFFFFCFSIFQGGGPSSETS